MGLWFTESHTNNVKFSIKLNKQLCSVKSKYQQIDILDSYEFGRILTLDGVVMVTEKDEFIYHEMIVHVPMSINKNIKKVLVIGAGDGGAIRELTKYKTVEEIDMVEIDELVVKVCKEYLPTLSSAFDDKRINFHFVDGLKFIRTKEKEYDLIIVDSTDPFGPGEGLFTKEFYANCYDALKDDGMLVNQHDSIFYSTVDKTLKKSYNILNSIFPVFKLFSANIPTYPSGLWLFGFSSKKYDPVKDYDESYFDSLGFKTKYYNSLIHKGSFYLPNYVKELIEEC